MIPIVLNLNSLLLQWCLYAGKPFVINIWIFCTVNTLKRNCNACSESVCYNPEWEVHEDQNSMGASEHSGVESVQECLDYCGSQSTCVAVDVDLTQQPPICWPHFSTDDLLDRNVYSQPGTNQYRLTERCVDKTTGINIYLTVVIPDLWIMALLCNTTFCSYQWKGQYRISTKFKICHKLCVAPQGWYSEMLWMKFVV